MRPTKSAGLLDEAIRFGNHAADPGRTASVRLHDGEQLRVLLHRLPGAVPGCSEVKVESDSDALDVPACSGHDRI
jgi:hypothetical protein